MLQWQHQTASPWRKTKVKSKQNLGLSREEWYQNTENLLIPFVHWIQTKLRAGGILWITLLPSHKAHAWGEPHDTLTLMLGLTAINKLSLPWLALLITLLVFSHSRFLLVARGRRHLYPVFYQIESCVVLPCTFYYFFLNFPSLHILCLKI